MTQVMSMVGGYTIHYKSPSQQGNVYTPLPCRDQIKALDFLLEQTLSPPEWLVSPKILKRAQYSTYPDYILEIQNRLLYQLLNVERIKRLEYLESNGTTYDGITERVLERLQTALFEELFKAPKVMDTRISELQVLYVNKLLQIIESEPSSLQAEKNRYAWTAHSKALIQAQLVKLKQQIIDNMDQCKTITTRGHAISLLSLMKDI